MSRWTERTPNSIASFYLLWSERKKPRATGRTDKVLPPHPGVPPHVVSFSLRGRRESYRTAHSQPPVVAKYMVPLATIGEALTFAPRLMWLRIFNSLPAFRIHRPLKVGM